MHPFTDTRPTGQEAESAPIAAGALDWREIDEIKASVTALLCHEARGGLCVLAGFLDLAQDLADLLDETTLEMLRGSNKQLERVTSLLQELGNYSQLRPLSDSTQWASLSEVMAETQSVFHAQFGAGNFGLRTDLEPSAAATTVPAELTRLLLRSLADSAVRLDSKPASLRATARRDGGELHLEIERPLPSAHPSLHGMLVESFGRSSHSPDPQSGLALGQSIACRVARLLGGQLVMHHEIGVGVRFHANFCVDTTRMTNAERVR